MAGNKTAKMGHARQNNKKVTYICPDCGSNLELRKTLPSNTMNLVCTKMNKIPRNMERGWEVSHANYTDECGFNISFNQKSGLKSE